MQSLTDYTHNLNCFTGKEPEGIDYYHQPDELTSSKTTEQEEVFSQVLQDLPRLLDKNFKNSFRGSGYSGFKWRDRYNSFTYLQIGFKLGIEKMKASYSER